MKNRAGESLWRQHIANSDNLFIRLREQAPPPPTATDTSFASIFILPALARFRYTQRVRCDKTPNQRPDDAILFLQTPIGVASVSRQSLHVLDSVHHRSTTPNRASQCFAAFCLLEVRGVSPL